MQRLIVNNMLAIRRTWTRPISTRIADNNDSSKVDDIRITERCVSRLRTIAGDNECLRVTVDGGGCSGYEYKLTLETQINANDRCFERDGVRVVVDDLSLAYMRGATIDYVDELMRSTFRVVNNPVAEKGCSCGSSFALKMD